MVTRDKALKTLKRLFGDKAYWRVGEPVSSPEKRAKALAEAEALKVEIEKLDAEYQRRYIAAGLHEVSKQRYALKDKRQQALSWSRYHKFDVGCRDGIFVKVTGEGDTWAEALDKATARKADTP